MSGKKEKVGVIRPGDVKVRKKSPPAGQVHHSDKDYDRKRRKQADRKMIDEAVKSGD